MRFISIVGIALAALSAGVGTAANEPGAPSAIPRTATAAEVSALNELLQKIGADFNRWAYTEHRIFRDHRGKVKSEQLVRFDPSLPYKDQWTPLKIDGRDPTGRERAKFRRRGEDSAPRDAGKPATPNPDNRRRRSLGELIDLSRTSLASESSTHWVFEIPLLKVGNERFPPEKFRVLARVRKDGHALENISVNLRESFRSKVVVKVKSGEASLDFARVDPKYPPTLVGILGDAVAAVLFVNVGGSMQLTRTELKHVRPFDERFEVQIGTIKAIDF